MSNKKDYAAKLDAALKIDENSILVPTIPVEIYLQEAEDLYQWSITDKEELLSAGLTEEVIENLSVLAGATREAQSVWMKELKTQKEAVAQWREESEDAFEFRDQLLHTFRYAFRKNEELLSAIDEIAEGGENADMVQDLNDLAILGKANSDLLKAIGFDEKQLDKAATDSDYFADLLGQSNGQKYGVNESKDIRDRMYTLLKQVVDEVRDCGKYVFWKDDKRLKGYSSAYSRKSRSSADDTEEVDETVTTIEEVSAESSTEEN